MNKKVKKNTRAQQNEQEPKVNNNTKVAELAFQFYERNHILVGFIPNFFK
jgi:hypothetical protein